MFVSFLPVYLVCGSLHALSSLYYMSVICWLLTWVLEKMYFVFHLLTDGKFCVCSQPYTTPSFGSVFSGRRAAWGT